MVNLGRYTIHGWYAGTRMGLGKETFIIFLDELIRISPLLQREVHMLLVVPGIVGSLIQKQSVVWEF